MLTGIIVKKMFSLLWHPYHLFLSEHSIQWDRPGRYHSQDVKLTTHLNLNAKFKNTWAICAPFHMFPVN
jgi:hypothetical protein